MKPSRMEWKVGVFVLIGLVLLAGLLIQFSKGTTFFRPTYEINLRAGNAGGMKPRAMVLMSGLQIGTVSSIHLAPDGKSVIMTLRIFSQYHVRKDARFTIEQSGFLGDQFVAITPGKFEGEELKPGDFAQAESPFNIQEAARAASGFIRRLDETAKNLNEAIADVRRLVLNESTLSNFSSAVTSFRTVSDRALITVDNINTLVASNSTPTALAISNLVVFSEEINRFATGFTALVSTNTAEVTSAVKNIENSTEVLKTLLADLEQGKGLAGSLIKNQELATNVAQIASNLSITTSNLNRLGLWGILWSRKAPRTTASQPAGQLASPKAGTD